MRSLCAALLLLLPQDAELKKQLERVAERAGHFDPEERHAAVKEAAALFETEGERLGKLARSKNAPALAILTLAGKHEADDLLKLKNRTARIVACYVLGVRKEHLGTLLKMSEENDRDLRLAAGAALGRVTDAALQGQITMLLQPDPRKPGFKPVFMAYLYSFWTPNVSVLVRHFSNPDPAIAEFAVAAFCNGPAPVKFPKVEEHAVSVLTNEKIGLEVRRLFVRHVGSKVPVALIPLLSSKEVQIRSRIVEALDQGLSNPFDAPALFAEVKEVGGAGGWPGASRPGDPAYRDLAEAVVWGGRDSRELRGVVEGSREGAGGSAGEPGHPEGG